jgi:elongation factor G
MPFSTPPFRPILSMALTVNPADGERLSDALLDFDAQDPAFSVITERQTGVCVIRGSSERHLRSICERISREYLIDISLGEPQVIFIETIRKAARAEGKYIRQTGGSGNYGHVKIRLEPNELGKDFEFVNELEGGVIPDAYIKPIEQGIRQAAQAGILASREVVSFKATLYDGSCHELDSNEMAFRIAGALAFKEAARKANPVLLEPVMAVTVTAPEEHMGTIIADINSRRGRIEGIEHVGGLRAIKAIVPLADLLGHTDKLRSQFSDRVSCTMEFARYESRPYGSLGDGSEAGFPVTRPHGPTPRMGSAAVDPDSDWT